MMNAALFSAYGTSKRILGESPTNPLTIKQYWYAGFLAGLAVAFVEGPVDFFKCQLQMRPDQYKGFLHCSTSIIKERGPLGAYQGIIPTLWRNAPANAAWYGVYEMARQYQLKPGESRNDLAKWRVMISGGLGGWAYWLSTYPIDLIKSTIQADHIDPKQRKYTGTMDAVNKIYSNFGVKGFFFRGITPCLIRAPPINASTFLTFELVQQFFRNIDNKKKNKI